MAPNFIGDQYASLTNPAVSAQPPQSLTDMGVNIGLTLHAVNKKLQVESTLDDVHAMNMANVVSVGKNPMAIPNAIYMQLEAPATGSRDVVVPMRKPLRGAPRMGSAELQKGFERPFELMYAKFYYNEYSYAVAGSEWGVEYNDVNVFGLYKEIQPAISKYFKEVYGKWIREATLRKYSEPLTKDPVGLTQHWNKNWFIANTDFGSQPTYDATEADFRAAITTALGNAATGTNGVNANIDIDYLLALEHYAANIKRIEPLMLSGIKSYIVMVPSSQMHLLRSLEEGQAGGLWKNITNVSKEEVSYPGYIGRIGSLILVEDQRYPTIVESGGAFSVEYVEPGNDDERSKTVYNSTSNKSWDIGTLYGKAAICDWLVRDLHFETDSDDYGKIFGKGAFGERGIQLVEYDVDSATDTSRVNYGSIVLAMSTPNIVTTA